MQPETWRQSLAVLQNEHVQGAPVTEDALCALVKVLWEQQHSFLRSSEKEVSETLAFLFQQLANPKQQTDKVITCKITCCRLTEAVLSTPQRFSLPNNTAQILCTTLRQWADACCNDDSSAVPAVVSARQAAVHASKVHTSTAPLQLAALTTVASFIRGHISKLSGPEVAALLAVLGSAAHSSTNAQPVTEHSTSRNSRSPGTSSAQQQNLERSQAAVAAMAVCFPKNEAPLIPQDSISQMTSATVSALHSWCIGSSQAMESAAHAKLLAPLLRLLNTLIIESKKAWTQHATTLINDLRKLLTYGVHAQQSHGSGMSISPGLSSSSSSLTAGSKVIHTTSGTSETAGTTIPSSRAQSAYVPPHARQRQQQQQQQPARPRRESSTERGWSDSELSDMSDDGSASTHDRPGFSRVRVSVLICLQSLAKSDGRSLQPLWTSLLPVQYPLQPRPLAPHLVTAMLHDPVSKVRSMAAATIAALLEGPAARGFLMVADARSNAANANARTHTRAFTTLSASLGQLVLCTHSGCMHALQHETNIQVVLLVLRATCVLVGSAPVEKLPPSLFIKTLETVRNRCHVWLADTSELPATEQQALLTGYLSCITEVLGTRKAVPKLADRLATTEQPAVPSTKRLDVKLADNDVALPATSTEDALVKQESLGCALLSELLAYSTNTQPTVRIEALAAMRGLAEHYLSVLQEKLPSVWADISAAAAHNLAASQQSHTRAPSRSSSMSGSNMRASASGAANNSMQSKSGGPEVKAAQQAIKLVGTFLTATAKGCGMVTSAIGQEPDASSVDVSLPAFLQNPRSQAAVGSEPAGTSIELPVSTAATQQLVDWWKQALDLLLPAVTSHPSPMVQSAAALAISEIPEPVFNALQPMEQQRVLQAAIQACSGRESSAAAVSTAGCKLTGAIAAFPGTLHQAHLNNSILEVLPQLLMHSTQSVRIAAAATLAATCEAAASDRPGCLAACFEQHAATLAQTALQAAQGDAEKVAVNGIRAVGALLYCLPWPAYKGWIDAALTALQSSLTTGSVKVQWSACTAVQSLFSNHLIMTTPERPAMCTSLLLVLIMLVRDCGNYKVRAQAAAALAAVPNKDAFGTCLTDAVLVTCTALDALESGHSVHGNGVSSSGTQAPGETTTAEGRESDSLGFPNYRYLPLLLSQLGQTLMHLLPFVTDADVQRSRDAISKRLPVMLRIIGQAAQAKLSLCQSGLIAPTVSAAGGERFDPVVAGLPDDLLGSVDVPNEADAKTMPTEEDWVEAYLSMPGKPADDEFCNVIQTLGLFAHASNAMQQREAKIVEHWLSLTSR